MATAAALPDNWQWRDRPLEGGPAVVFDIDGVLSDAAGRQHHLQDGRRDWEAFFNAAGEDPLIAEVARLLELLDDDLAVVLVTGRPNRVRELTRDWLARHELRWDLLIMRPGGRGGYSREYKRTTIDQLREAGFDLRLAFEDDRNNVAMFHNAGIPCIYIHSGYYD